MGRLPISQNNYLRAQKSHHSDNFVVAQLRQFCINARKRSLRKIDIVRCKRPPICRKHSAYGKRVNLRLYLIVWSHYLDFLFRQLETKSENKNNFLARGKTTLFRSATIFANALAHGKRVNLRLCNLCEALKISRKEGENAAQPLYQAALGGVSLKISTFCFDCSKQKVRTKIIDCARQNRVFAKAPSICRKHSAYGKGETAALKF